MCMCLHNITSGNAIEFGPFDTKTRPKKNSTPNGLQFVCLIAVAKILKWTVILGVLENEMKSSCSIMQFDAKCRHLRSRMRPKPNQKYGRHLSVQIQNTFSELINWSTVLMVSKWFYMKIAAIIFIDYSVWSVRSVCEHQNPQMCANINAFHFESSVAYAHLYTPHPTSWIVSQSM